MCSQACMFLTLSNVVIVSCHCALANVHIVNVNVHTFTSVWVNISTKHATCPQETSKFNGLNNNLEELICKARALNPKLRFKIHHFWHEKLYIIHIDSSVFCVCWLVRRG